VRTHGSFKFFIFAKIASPLVEFNRGTERHSGLQAQKTGRKKEEK